MYVVELDRPWLDTPFLVQGFLISSVRELESLSELCNHVYVDTGRSKKFHAPPKQTQVSKERIERENLEKTLNISITEYADSASMDEELLPATKVFQDFETMVSNFYGEVRSSNSIDLTKIRQPVNNVVDSVIRNPDACALLTKLRRKGDYTYNHAIGCSVWAAAIGRQLGLPKEILVSLSIGAMLLDIGKLQIPDSVLKKQGELSPEETSLVKNHVDRGLEMLKRTRGVDRIAFQMIMSHHERHNGKGYPRKVVGKLIPIYARIAGIVDTYDALINDKPYRKAMAPSEAIRTLYNVRGVDFQSELVEEFIQALGVYPAGSIVELNTGAVGIVYSENRRRRLRPKLIMLLDSNKNPLPEKTYLDLYTNNLSESGEPLEIRKSLQPGEYGLVADDILL